MTVERVKPSLLWRCFLPLLALVGLSAGADHGLPCDESNRANHSARKHAGIGRPAPLRGDSAPAQWYLSRGITPISLQH